MQEIGHNKSSRSFFVVLFWKLIENLNFSRNLVKQDFIRMNAQTHVYWLCQWWMKVIIIYQVFISCICRMRKFGFAAMMTLPMALIGMEMEMQDGDFDSKYCQVAMFALVFWSQWWWCWYFTFWLWLSNKTRSQCSAYSDDDNSKNDDAGSDRFSWNPKLWGSSYVQEVIWNWYC